MGAEAALVGGDVVRVVGLEHVDRDRLTLALIAGLVQRREPVRGRIWSAVYAPCCWATVLAGPHGCGPPVAACRVLWVSPDRRGLSWIARWYSG